MSYARGVLTDADFRRRETFTLEQLVSDPAALRRAGEQNRNDWNKACMPQVEALIAAGWRFELVREDSDPWQWAWRRPPRRAGSEGMRFASTQQAYNALTKGTP